MVLYWSSPHDGFKPQELRIARNRICEGGGTGRRARLRCVWFILGGSSPLPRTKNQYTSCAGFSFCAREGISNKAAAFMPQAISPVQQRRPQPAAETGRSCWGRVLIFQSPAKGLQKNQQTQPVRPCTAGQAISPAGCCLVRGSQRVEMSNNRLRFTVRREDSSYPFLFFIQMRYSPSVMRVSRYRMGVQHASRMGMGRLPVA